MKYYILIAYFYLSKLVIKRVVEKFVEEENKETAATLLWISVFFLGIFIMALPVL